MDSEMANGSIDRHGVCQMLRVYGVGGNFLRAVQNFYEDSRARFNEGINVMEWFPVKVGLR